MDTKEYLQQAFRLKLMIDADGYDLELFNGLINSTIHITKGNKPLLAKIKVYKTMISAKIESNRDLLNEIENCIISIENDNHRQLLYKRYIEHKTWGEIADEMYYTFQNCHLIHKKALNQLVIQKRGINNEPEHQTNQ